MRAQLRFLGLGCKMGWEEPQVWGWTEGPVLLRLSSLAAAQPGPWELALPNEASEGTLSPRDQRVIRLQCVNPGAEPCAFLGNVLGHSWNVLGKLA